jgi:hypothetical protein
MNCDGSPWLATFRLAIIYTDTVRFVAYQLAGAGAAGAIGCRMGVFGELVFRNAAPRKYD